MGVTICTKTYDWNILWRIWLSHTCRELRPLLYTDRHRNMAGNNVSPEKLKNMKIIWMQDNGYKDFKMQPTNRTVSFSKLLATIRPVKAEKALKNPWKWVRGRGICTVCLWQGTGQSARIASLCCRRPLHLGLLFILGPLFSKMLSSIGRHRLCKLFT